MKKRESVSYSLDHSSASQFSILNDIIDHLNDELIEILVKLFQIKNGNIKTQKAYIQNFIVPKLCSQSRDDFIELIRNLDIIKYQITPPEIFNSQFLDRMFYFVQTKENDQGELLIPICTKNKNKLTYVQVIPDGLLYTPQFIILENGKHAKSIKICKHTYLNIRNNGEKIKLKFIDCPLKIFFIQIIFYKKMSVKDLSQFFRIKFNIPNDISDRKAVLHHEDHAFKLANLIDSVKKDYNINQIMCPICNKCCDDFLYYGTNIADQVLDYILDDNEISLIESMSSFENDHVFISKFQVPKILQNQPSFLSLCAFFSSKKCFLSLLNLYLEKNESFRINQKDQSQRSPMHFACFGGELQIIEALIENNEIFDSHDYIEMCPIHYAAMNGKIEIIKFFELQQLDMFPIENLDSLTPLHLACKFGHLDIVKYYINTVIPHSNVQDFVGFLSNCCCNCITPLHTACQYGQNEIVKYFLTCHDLVSSQIKHSKDRTPYHIACQYGSLKCLKSLVNYGDKLIPCEYQLIEIFNAAIINGHCDIAVYLMKKNNMVISFTMILAAIGAEYFDIAKVLIENSDLKYQSCWPIIESLYKLICPGNDLMNNNESSNYYDEEESSDYFNEEESSYNEDGFFNDESSDSDTFFIKNKSRRKQRLSENNSKKKFKRNAKSYKSSDYEEEEEDYLNDESTDSDTFFIQNKSRSKQFFSRSKSKRKSKQNIKSYKQSYDDSSSSYDDNHDESFEKHKFTSNSFANSAFQNTYSLNPNSDPSILGYDENHGIGSPRSFTDLSKCNFQYKNQVKIAMQNISLIVQKSVHIVKSNEKKIVYKCIRGCNFIMMWKKGAFWYVPNDGFVEHTCTFENAKIPRLHSYTIDSAIKSMKLEYTNINAAVDILDHFFKNKVERRTLKRRLLSFRFDNHQSEHWWLTIPSYLKNNIKNGGLSDLNITENKEIHSFAMLPQYAVLLLKSNAILPVIIIDGTFQSSIYRGTLVIVMIVSSNRTNIPIGWAWGPNEDADTVKLILKLIKEIKDDIETIISDEGTAIKAVVKEVFPDSNHKYCAWHVAKEISDQRVKNIFWLLLRAEHRIIFQDLISKLYQISGENIPSVLKNGRIGMFARFFEGVKENDLVTSSPCESVNAEIRKLKTEMPIKIFHHLETIGFNRCLDLLDLKTKMTPYYSKRLSHLLTKAERLIIVEDESFGTSRTIIDPKYPIDGVRWEVNTRDYHCECGKYTDRGFPCAHMIKAFQDLNQPFEQCVHESYFTSTIQSALKDLNSPVPLSSLEIDETLHCPPSHSRPCKVKRYLFSFEKKQNRK